MADCEQCAALRAEVERLKALTVKADEAIARQQQDLEEAADRAADCDILRAEVERLTVERDRQYDQNAEQITRIAALEAENERLRAALREAYEVYAGSDGFIPETAGEGYQQQIIRQMVNCISAALEEKPND